MKGLIVYKSRYGSTKAYAAWLQEATGFDLCEVKQCPRALSPYDVVVVGSSVLAGRLVLGKWLRQHWPELRQKTVLVLLVHVTEDPEVRAKIVPQSLPEEIASQVTVFPVGGRYMLRRMSFLDRTMITVVASMEKRPEVKQELLADRDLVHRENLEPILAHIRRLQAAEP